MYVLSLLDIARELYVFVSKMKLYYNFTLYYINWINFDQIKSFSSCCIDFISAQHVSADAIIHFGKSCLSKAEEIIPFLKIHLKLELQVDILCDSIRNKFVDSTQQLNIIFDTSYIYKIGKRFR